MTIEERNDFITKNYKLLIACCEKLHRLYIKVERDDVMGVVHLASIEAADKWDPKRGAYSTILYLYARKKAHREFVYDPSRDKRNVPILSLDKTYQFGEGEEVNLKAIAPDRTVDVEKQIEIKDRIERINKRFPAEAEIIRLRMMGHSYIYIAELYGVTKQRIQQRAKKWLDAYKEDCNALG